MTILWMALFAVENDFRYDDPGRTCSGDFEVVPVGGSCNDKVFLCEQGAFLKYCINLQWGFIAAVLVVLLGWCGTRAYRKKQQANYDRDYKLIQ